MSRKVVVLGVGTTQSFKPGTSPHYYQMAATAMRDAFTDANISFEDVDQAYVGYVYGESTCGQRAIYEAGLRGIPIFNVNNNCATGSTALFLARQAVEGGQAECALALGFEQMDRGALRIRFPDLPHPSERHLQILFAAVGKSSAPIPAQFYGAAARVYRDRYGMRRETLAQIAVKSRQHASRNPKALFREPVSLAEVLDSPVIFDPLTRLQCCPPSCGAAAAIVCSADFARRHRARLSVVIASQAISTDQSASFESGDPILLSGYDLSRRAAEKVYEEAGIGPDDIDVVELHDCFTANELISYEALRLCNDGDAERFVSDAQNTYGGQTVVNPSGGLLSKGHPLGATGLLQCAELIWQLRNEAADRQVDGARIALQHNLGLGGACVVTMYVREDI